MYQPLFFSGAPPPEEQCTPTLPKENIPSGYNTYPSQPKTDFGEDKRPLGLDIARAILRKKKEVKESRRKEALQPKSAINTSIVLIVVCRILVV